MHRNGALFRNKVIAEAVREVMMWSLGRALTQPGSLKRETRMLTQAEREHDVEWQEDGGLQATEGSTERIPSSWGSEGTNLAEPLISHSWSPELGESTCAPLVSGLL